MALRFGNLRYNVARLGAEPTAVGFDDEGNEPDAIGMALGSGVEVVAFIIFICSASICRVVKRLRCNIMPQTACDSKIESCGYAIAPTGNVNVRRAAGVAGSWGARGHDSVFGDSTNEGLGTEETWFL